MTTGEMQLWTNRFKEIVDAKANNGIKSMRLSNLMTDLESAYNIPMVGKKRIELFEAIHPHVMQLYRTVSEARVF